MLKTKFIIFQHQTLKDVFLTLIIPAVTIKGYPFECTFKYIYLNLLKALAV